jgi:futalosine hydrolase
MVAPSSHRPGLELVGFEKLREATSGCRLVLLAATEVEAEPLRAALREPRAFRLATKTLYVGDMGAERPVEAGGAEALTAGARTVLAVSGCDKANAAHMLTCLLQAMSPAPVLVLQVGIAGALPSVGPTLGAGLGDLVVATEEVYSDTGSSSPNGWISARELGLPIAQVDGVELGGSFTLDFALVRLAMDAIAAIDWRATDRQGEPPSVLAGLCVTSSVVTGRRDEAQLTAGRWQPLAESMEGAAAAHICALYRVAFLEIRGISNLVGDRDRGAWAVDKAVATAARAALAVAEVLDSLPLRGLGGTAGLGGASGAAGTRGTADLSGTSGSNGAD